MLLFPVGLNRSDLALAGWHIHVSGQSADRRSDACLRLGGGR